MVFINGVTQAPADFVTKGHKIVFAHAPNAGAAVEFKTITNTGTNTASYTGTGTQTVFNLPAWPREKFAVVTDTKETVPAGYTVVDVDTEIDLWIRDNCPVSDWKWADQLDGTTLVAGFGMSRMIVKDSVLTYIATKWSA